MAASSRSYEYACTYSCKMSSNPVEKALWDIAFVKHSRGLGYVLATTGYRGTFVLQCLPSGPEGPAVGYKKRLVLRRRISFGKASTDVGYAVTWTARPQAGSPNAPDRANAILVIGGEAQEPGTRPRDMGVAVVEMLPEGRVSAGLLIGHGGPVYSLRPHPIHAGLIFSASVDSTVRLWDVLGRVCLASFSDLIMPPSQLLHLDVYAQSAERAGGSQRILLATCDAASTVRIYSWLENASGSSGSSACHQSGVASPKIEDGATPSHVFFKDMDIPSSAIAQRIVDTINRRLQTTDASRRLEASPPQHPVLLSRPGFSTQRPHGDIVDAVAFIPVNDEAGPPFLLSKQAGKNPSFGRLWRPSNSMDKRPFAGPWGDECRPSSIRTAMEYSFPDEKEQKGWWTRFAVHPNGRCFVLGRAGFLYIFDVAHGGYVQLNTEKIAGTVHAVDFSQDGRFLACCTSEGEVLLFESTSSSSSLREYFQGEQAAYSEEVDGRESVEISIDDDADRS